MNAFHGADHDTIAHGISTTIRAVTKNRVTMLLRAMSMMCHREQVTNLLETKMPETPNPLAVIAIARRVVQDAHDGEDVENSIDDLETALTEYDDAVAELAAREAADLTGASTKAKQDGLMK